MVRVKICGITQPADAVLAAECGADAIGLIFAASSPVRVDLAQARAVAAAVPPFVARVGVFTDAECDGLADAWASGILDAVQCYEQIPADALQAAGVPPDRVVRAVRVRDGGAVDTAKALGAAGVVHLDTFAPEREGGTGKTFDWALGRAVSDAGVRVMLAGGLTPENVGAAIEAVQPYAVDVRSGVEREPGVKDPDKVAAFCRAVRSYA